jgi:hypothetical protein
MVCEEAGQGGLAWGVVAVGLTFHPGGWGVFLRLFTTEDPVEYTINRTELEELRTLLNDTIDLDEKVSCTATDSTPNYLNNKLVSGDGVTLAVQDPGEVETIQVSVDNPMPAPSGTDGYVLTETDSVASWAAPTGGTLSDTTPEEISATGAAGEATSESRSDHVHAFPASFTPAEGAQAIVGTLSVRASGGDEFSEQLGETAAASGVESLAVGYASTAVGDYTVAVGKEANAVADECTAVGCYALANLAGATALGSSASAGSPGCTVLGCSASVSEGDATAVNQVCIGWGAGAGYAAAIAIGAGSMANADDSIAIGKDSRATSLTLDAVVKATALGSDAKALKSNTVAIGYGAEVAATESVAVGAMAVVSAVTAVAIGAASEVEGAGSIAIGCEASTGAYTSAIAIGKGATVTGDQKGEIGTSSYPIDIKLHGMHEFVAANEQTTVGAAGGASALPATPTKFFRVIDATGTVLVIPAYAAS